MSQEFKDIAYEFAVRTAPAGVLSWWASVNWTTALAILLGVLQVAYLLRKWWREETAWGMRLKRWAEGRFTNPGDLQ